MSQDLRPRTFTSSRGVTVTLKPMAGELDRLNALRARFDVSPPTYTIKTALGVEETHAHDATTLVTDEDKAAWADYLTRQAQAQRQYTEIWAKSIALNGVAFDDDALAAWAKRRAAIGNPVPEDCFERQIEWVTSELIGSPADYNELTLAVMEASGVPEEMISAAEAAFRNSLGQSDGSDAGATAGAAAGAAPMALQQKIRGGPSGRAVGDSGNKPVRQHVRKR